MTVRTYANNAKRTTKRKSSIGSTSNSSRRRQQQQQQRQLRSRRIAKNDHDNEQQRSSPVLVASMTMTMNDDASLSAKALQQQLNTNNNNSKKIKRKTLYWGSLISAIFLLPAAQACIQSTELRERAARTSAATSSLLFWSSYDFSVDAVTTQFVGPLAALSTIRGGGSGADRIAAESVILQEDILSSDLVAFGNGDCDDVGNDIVKSISSSACSSLAAAVSPYGLLERRSDDVLQNDVLVVSPRGGASASTTKDDSSSGDDDDQHPTVDSNSSTATTTTKMITKLSGGSSTNNTVIGDDYHADASKVVRSDPKKMVFSFYQNGDGSETDPDGIPTRYLLMQEGNRAKAAKAAQETVQWRKDNDIDNLLKKPHPKYDVCKASFPHYFLGRDKNDHVVFLQRPAGIDLPKLYKNGAVKEELLTHYIYVNEYLWQIMEGDKPLGTMTSILDISGLHFSDIKKTDLVNFCKTFISTMDSHFPQRAHKTLIVNAPKWFSVVYKMASPLMRASTKSKIEVLARGKKQDDILVKVLGDKICKNLPPKFWSKKKLKQMGITEDGDNSTGSSSSSSADEEDEDGGSSSSSADGDEITAADPNDNSTDEEKPRLEPYTPPDSTLEDEIRSYVLSQLKASGMKMQEVL